MLSKELFSELFVRFVDGNCMHRSNNGLPRFKGGLTVDACSGGLYKFHSVFGSIFNSIIVSSNIFSFDIANQKNIKHLVKGILGNCFNYFHFY